MYQKTTATVMALIMAFAVFAAVPGLIVGSDEGTSEENAYYLAGSASVPAVIKQENTAGITVKIDFNQAAYTIKGDEVKIQYRCTKDTYTDVELGKQYTFSEKKLRVTVNGTDDSGVYTVLLENVNKTKNTVDTRVFLKVSFTTVFKDSELDLEYYYAVNVRTVGTGGGSGGGDDEDTGFAIEVYKDTPLDGNKVTDYTKDYLTVYKGVVPVFPLRVVDTLNGNAFVPDTYSFYASGLPDGLGVRIVSEDDYEFEITGKAEYNIDIDEELGYALYPLTITAVDLDGNILEPPVNINLRVYYSDSDFSYEVVELDPDGKEVPGQDPSPVHGDSSKIVKGGDSIQIKTLKTDGETSNPGVKAYVQTIDDEGKAVEKELDKDKDGNYVYSSEADDSGVVEIYLKGPAVGSTQITHKLTVLVVGEVVHSGLDPRVTSS